MSRHTVIVLKNGLNLLKKKNSRYSEDGATIYDFRQNFLQGINVSGHTETVPKKVLSGSKTPHGTVKTEQQITI